jgi:hypothetical protein
MLGRVKRVALLPLLGLMIAGCGAGAFEPSAVRSEPPVSLAQATPRPEVSLAVTAVQLETTPTAASDGSNRLVVVIDNRGRRRVEARVRVRLAGDDPSDTLAEISRDAGSVAAGESRVVRFEIPAEIPDRSCYTLSVQVLPGGEVTEMTGQGTRVYRLCPGR